MINTRDLKSIPPRLRAAIKCFPDFLSYDLDYKTYRETWFSLLRPKRSRYIYANGLEVRRAGIFRYAFETVKGWFGFTNHCAKDIVQLSLRKLAYYGYVRGYNEASTFENLEQLHKDYQLPATFKESILSERCDERSARLQKSLVAYYRKHSHSLPKIEEDYVHQYFGSVLISPKSANYFFGYTYDYFGLYKSLVNIDPQDERAIYPLLLNSNEGDFFKPIKGSKFHHRYVRHLVGKIKSNVHAWQITNLFLDSYRVAYESALAALALSPEVENDNPEIFIKCYLRKKDYINAARVLVRLSPSTALTIAQLHFNTVETIQYIDSQSELAKQYADYLADECLSHLDAYFNHNNKAIEFARLAETLDASVCIRAPHVFIRCAFLQSDFHKAARLINELSEKDAACGIAYVKKYFGNDLAKLSLLDMSSAVGRAYRKELNAASAVSFSMFSLFGSAESVDEDLDIIALLDAKEPLDAFHRFVREKAWSKAYQLFIKHRKLSFNESSLIALSQALRVNGEGEKAKALAFEQKQYFRQAEACYRDGLVFLRQAHSVIASPEHQAAIDKLSISLANVIVSGDISLGKATLARTETALDYLVHVRKDLRDGVWKDTIASVIALRIQLLKEKCLVAASDEYALASKATTQKTKITVAKMKTSLMMLIDLLKTKPNLSDKEARLLADSYFRLAELANFFELEMETTELYRKAYQFSPNNAFYALTYAEQLADVHLKHDDIRDRGIELLHELGLSAMDFLHWHEERWQPRENRIYKMAEASEYVVSDETNESVYARFR